MDTPTNARVPDCPYVGLQPYSEAERDYFFGREQDTETIAANLLTAPLTLLYGASGVGKTSVLAAGVVPYLRAMPDVLVVQFRAWQDETFQVALMDGVEEAVYYSRAKLLDFRQPPLDEFLARAAQEINRTILIILDQFEEYFLYHPNANPFDEQFARAVNRGDINANFLLSLREDALSQLDRFETRISNLMSNYLRLEHLNRDGAERAIRKPLNVYNARRADAPPVTIEDALVNALIEQVQTGRVTLGQAGQGDVGATASADARIETPFLQMVLTRLWDEETRAGSHNLKLETLNRLGGAEKIVCTHLDTVMSRLRAREQEVCSSFFDRLVTPSGTKIAQNADDLVTYAARPAAQVAPVLKKLADQRVLRPIAPPLNQPRAARYEIFHDVLAAAVLDWQRRFVERKRVRRFRLALLGTALLVLVLATLAIIAGWAYIHATTAETQANSRRLAAQSAFNRDGNFDLALLLGVEALHLDNNLEARGNLLDSLTSRPQLVSYLHGHEKPVLGAAFSPDGRTLASASFDNTIILWDVSTHKPIGAPLTGHKAEVFSVAFSPDGKILASASADTTIILWDASTRQPISAPLTGHKGAVRNVVFSPNGKMLASASYDSTIILWDVSARQPIGLPLSGHESNVFSVAFSPDGKTLASGSTDHTIILWDVNTRQPIGQPLTGHKDTVYGVTFSPDGKTLASASADGTVILWDVKTRQPIGQPLTGHKDYVFCAVFSPDGRTLVSGSKDRTVILWDMSTRQPIGPPLTGHSGPVYSVAFSPDGKTLASTSFDNTIILWNVSINQRIGVSLTGHKSWVNSVAFSPDGKILASGSGDKTIILWDVGTRQPIGQPLTGNKAGVASVAFSPNGKVLASRSFDNTIILWDVSTRQPIGQLLTGNNAVTSVAFSPDSKVLASASCKTGSSVGLCEQGEITLWDVSTRQPIGQPLTGHKNYVTSLAFSPDGKVLASASCVMGSSLALCEQGEIILWDVSTRQPIGQPLTGHKGFVSSVAFSPDGKILASASADATIIVWDVSTRRPIGQPITGHKAGVTDMAFSPDGRMLASAGCGHTTNYLGFNSQCDSGEIFLWGMSTRQSIGQPLTGHMGVVSSVAFSPDGKILASGSSDQTIILWDVDLESWKARACYIANRNLTLEEWQQYINPDLSTYRATCPGLSLDK